MSHSIVMIVAPEDREVGRAIAQWLIARSIPLGRAKQDPKNHQIRWPDQAAAAIVLVSPHANRSKYVQTEARHAQKRGLTIITLCLSDEPPRGPLYSPDDWPYLIQSGGIVRQRHLRQLQSHAVHLLQQAGTSIDMIELASDGTIALNDDDGDDAIIIQVKQPEPPPETTAPSDTSETTKADTQNTVAVPLESIDEDADNEGFLRSAWRQTSRRDKAIVIALLAAAVLFVGMMSRSVVRSVTGPHVRMQDAFKTSADDIIKSLAEAEADDDSPIASKPSNRNSDHQAADEALASRMARAEQRAAASQSPPPATHGKSPQGGSGTSRGNPGTASNGSMPPGMPGPPSNSGGSPSASPQPSSQTPGPPDDPESPGASEVPGDPGADAAAQTASSITEQLQQMAQEAAALQQATPSQNATDAAMSPAPPLAEAVEAIVEQINDLARSEAEQQQAKDAPPNESKEAAPSPEPKTQPTQRQQIEAAIAEVMKQIESESESEQSAESKALRNAVNSMRNRASRKIQELTKQVASEKESSDALLQRSEEHLNNGNPAQALADARQALEKNADDIGAALLAGQALRALDQHDEAIAAFDKAIDDLIHAAEGHTQRGEALADLERYEAALSDFKSALRIDPDHAEAIVGMARVRALQGKPSAAIDLATTAIERKPQLASAYTQRGSSLTDMHRYRRAVGDLDRAIQLDPRQAAAYARRAQAWEALSDNGRAGANADMAILLNPNNTLGHVMRAKVLLARSAFADAQKHLDIAMSLNPNHAPAHAVHGLVMLRRGQWQDAAADFDKALRDDRSSTFALLGRARLHRRAGRLDDAIADADRVLAINPESDEALLIRAAAHRDAGRLGKALMDCQAAIQHRPQNANACIGTALVQLADQDRAGAARSLARAYQINPNDALTIAAHAYGCMLVGDNVRARAFAADAQRREPARDTVYLAHGLIDYHAGRFDAALANADAAAQLNAMSVNAHLLTIASAIQLQRYPQAAQSAEAALSINPNCAAAYFARAKLHQANGQSAQAKSDIAQARRLNRALDTRGPIPLTLDLDD